MHFFVGLLHSDNAKRPRQGTAVIDIVCTTKGLRHRLNTAAEARQFSPHGIARHHALDNASHQLRLRPGESFLCCSLIAASDRQLDGLNRGANAAEPRAIDEPLPLIAANAFLGRFMFRHA